MDAQGQLDRLVERQVAPESDRLVQHRRARCEDARLATGTVPEPSSERSTDPVVLDGAPEEAGPFRVTASRRDAGDDSDAEDTSAVVVHLLGEFERLRRLHLCVVEPFGLEREGCQFGEHAGVPPRDPRFAGEFRAASDELVGSIAVPGVALDRPECADGLREAPDVAVRLVNHLAGLDELTRSVEIALPHLDEPDPMELDRPAMLVSELVVQREAALIEIPRDLELAGYVGRASEGAIRLSP